MAFKGRYFLLCTICIAISSTMAMNWNMSNLNLSKEDQGLAQTTLLIIRKHLTALTTTIRIAERSKNLHTSFKHAAIMDYLLLNLNETISVELDMSDYKLDYCILIVDSPASLGKLLMRSGGFSSSSLSTFDNHPYHFIIVLTSPTSDINEKNIRKIFIYCSMYLIINANLIASSPANGAISMYTYDLFDEKGCNQVQPFVYFTFDQDFQNLKTVFPQKMTNFFGCPLTIAARDSPPFLKFKGNFSDPQPVGDWENLTGFEGMLLKYLSRALNFTIDMQPFTDIYYGFWTVQHVDLAIGSLRSSDDFHSHSTSITYYNTELMPVIRGKIMSPLSILIMPFRIQLWLVIAILLTLISLLIHLMRVLSPSSRHFDFGGNNNTPYMNLFGRLVGYPVTGEPKRYFARFCFIMFVILALVLRTGYQGVQFEAFRRDKIFASIPSGFEQLVEDNYELLLPEDMTNLELYKPSSVITSKDLDQERLAILDKTKGNNASLVLRDSFNYYMAETYRRQTESQLLMINEIVFSYQMVMEFRLNSIYLPVFNKKLQSLIDSGITSKLIKEIKLEGDKRSEEKALRPVNEKLTLRNLEGVFELYLCFSMGAIAIFGFEVFSKHCKALKRVFEWID